MKKLLIFFVLFSLALPTQTSASACLHSHLAYPKTKVEKPKHKHPKKAKCDFFRVFKILQYAFWIGLSIFFVILIIIHKTPALLLVFALLPMLYSILELATGGFDKF